MPRILLTAFKPFADWDQNSSWLALQALMRDLPPSSEITTRLYPVEYNEVRSRLAADLQGSYDVVLHIGQSSGSSVITYAVPSLMTRMPPTGVPGRSSVPLLPVTGSMTTTW